jgi:8-oxo-dGTP diphosphatase
VPGIHALQLVSAGIICRDGRVLIGQRRNADKHALKWEFPGGKVESGESPEEALARELREELSIDATIGAELARYEHEYASGSGVHLLFFAVPNFNGEPTNRVYKQICSTPLRDLTALDFLEGDVDFVRRLARGDFEQQLES